MKTTLYYAAACLMLASLAPTELNAQGCVAVRNMGSHSLNYGDDAAGNSWQFSLNYRYFRSFRHFKGTEEQKERLVENTEVVNNDNSIVLAAEYSFNRNWAVSAQLPFVYIDRSSLYEHDRQNRHVSHSDGIGDIRLTGYRNLQAGDLTRLQIGLGVKLPTGNKNAKDYFYTADGPQLRPVDQSIQPGDGGTGILLEFNGQHQIGGNTYVYLNSLYMFNPRNTNGVRTFRETLSPLLANEAIMSVPDQYFLRLGAAYSLHHKFTFGAGARVEGIPVEDLIGKSDGFRRPGYIISLEPSIGFMQGVHSFNVSVPFALARNRTQSVTDKETQKLTGVPRHGDAAFADWLLSITYSYRLAR